MNIRLAHVTSFLAVRFTIRIRRLYLYLSLNNHDSLENAIINHTQRHTFDSFMTYTSRDSSTG